MRPDDCCTWQTQRCYFSNPSSWKLYNVCGIQHTFVLLYEYTGSEWEGHQHTFNCNLDFWQECITGWNQEGSSQGQCVPLPLQLGVWGSPSRVWCEAPAVCDICQLKFTYTYANIYSKLQKSIIIIGQYTFSYMQLPVVARKLPKVAWPYNKVVIYFN